MLNPANHRRLYRTLAIAALMVILVATSDRLRADTGTCGGAMVTLPFSDVASSNVFFCSIAEAFFSGLTNGTTPTTYSPSTTVTRDQMAAFVTRTQGSALRRGSLRAALNQWARATLFPESALTDLAGSPQLVAADGADLWIAIGSDNTVKRVRAIDGRVLEIWTGATAPVAVLVAFGRVFVTGATLPGSLYTIDPREPPGAVTTLTNALGNSPQGITTDGTFIWTANLLSSSVSRVNPDTGAVTNFTTNIFSPIGILYDGANIWETDAGSFSLKKLNPDGSVAQTVAVGSNPLFPVFDGTNIWVPNEASNSLTVVRASTGAVLATLIGNGLNGPTTAAFDGQRILVTNKGGNTVSLWKATDLTPIGFVPTGASSQPFGACSDGVNFWITLAIGKLARF
jgi:uncharacterized protein DUF6923